MLDLEILILRISEIRSGRIIIMKMIMIRTMIQMEMMAVEIVTVTIGIIQTVKGIMQEKISGTEMEMDLIRGGDQKMDKSTDCTSNLECHKTGDIKADV